MFRTILAISAAGFVTLGSAQATVFTSSSLQDLNGSRGSGVATTTADQNGKRTIVVGTGGDSNRVSGATTFGSWFQANVGGGGTVGITNDFAFDGNGSAYFSTVNEDSKGDLQYYFGTSAPVLTPLSALTSLSYDFYKSSLSTTSNYAPVLRLDILKGGKFAGSLVFEDVYQNQTPPPVDTWTMLTATLNSGIFWATNAALGPTLAAANGGQKTLQQWIDANTGSDLSVYGMSIGAGSGWTGSFRGALDDVNVAFTNGPTFLSNFEIAAPVAVPEPASILITLGGLGALTMFRRRRSV